MTHKDETARVLVRQGSISLVHLAGRRLPAVAVQGDTLQVLMSECRALLQAAEAGNLDEARVSGEIIEDMLRPGLDAYAEAVRQIESATAAAE